MFTCTGVSRYLFPGSSLSGVLRQFAVRVHHCLNDAKCVAATQGWQPRRGERPSSCQFLVSCRSTSRSLKFFFSSTVCLRMLLCAERSATVGRKTRHEDRVVSLSGVCGVIKCDVVSGGWSGVRRHGFKHVTFPVHLGELVSFVPGTHLTV